MLAGCITTYEDAPLFGKVEAPAIDATALTIPFGGNAAAENGAAGEFYRGVIGRMHEAVEEHDGETLEALLARYEHANLPPAVKQTVHGFREVARGLRFREHARTAAVIVAAPGVQAPGHGADGVPREGGQPALGAPLHLELQLPAPPDAVVLGGEGDADPIGFLVALSIEDTFVDGGASSSSRPVPVWLPATLSLSGTTVLRLPIDIDFPADQAVKRHVSVRVDLMGGYIHHDQGRAPVPRTTIASTTLTQWPVGYDAVVKAPLAELRQALAAFGPKTYARAFLAAQATTGADREIALGLLVEPLRFGRADQAQVAMAALRAMTDVDLAIGDRDGWLAWWQQSQR
jgi:hypothetical protein